MKCVITNEYRRIIYNAETKQTIAIVDNIDKELIKHIIDMHNEEIDLAFRDGIKEGKDITKDVYKL